MKYAIHPDMERFRPFIETLPTHFNDPQAETLFAGRNTVRAFTIEGERIVVKRFRAPSGINRLLYGRLRKSKARRAFEHASMLLERGVHTPHPIAWCEEYRGKGMACSYLVTAYSEYHDLKLLTQEFPAPHTTEALRAFAGFVVELHEKGIMHGDFNNSNTQWLLDAEGNYHFELIDINRMEFKDRPLTRKECFYNLRRLTCPLAPYTYIMACYAEVRGWNSRYTQLDAAEGLLGFIRARDRRNALKRFFFGKKKK